MNKGINIKGGYLGEGDGPSELDAIVHYRKISSMNLSQRSGLYSSNFQKVERFT